MKELSIEGKAKRYDEAIKRAKSKIKNDKDHVLYEDDVIEIFPELAESEDEKIKKEIIELIMLPTWKTEKEFHRRKELLSWLEKQGEEIIPLEQIILNVWELGMYWKELTKGFCNTEYGTQLDYIAKHWKEGEHYIKSLKKQGEQKPSDKVEPKFKCGDRVRNKKSGVTQILGSCIEDVYEGAFPFRIKEQDDWELVKQKPDWSEEDESWFKELELMALSFSNDDSYRKKFFDWLKSLKYRVQPKQEWSKEDEELYDEIRDAIYYSDCVETAEDIENMKETLFKAANWMEERAKYLQPQPKQELGEEDALGDNIDDARVLDELI